MQNSRKMLEVEGPELSATFAKVTWRIVPFLCCCYLMAYLDRINVGFAKLQMLGELRFSEAVYGLGAGIFFVGYVLLEVPSNMILERVGARRWIARIMISWGAISALGAFVSTPVQFYIVRLLLGAAEAGFLPGVLFYLTHWFPSYRRSGVIALFMIGLPLSSILGSPLSGWILGHLNHAFGLSGWRWLFLLEGLPTAVLGFFALSVLTEAPGNATWLTFAEQKALGATLDADNAETPSRGHRLIEGLFDVKVWMLGGVDFAILLNTYALGFWMPSFIRSAGVADPFRIGLLTALPSVAGLAGMLLLSRSSDRRRERRWHIIAPFLVGACAMAASTRFVHDVGMTVFLFSLASAAILGPIPVFFSLPSTFLRGPAAAAGFALATSIASIAGLISNYLMGIALDLTGSSTAAILFFAAFLLGGALLVYALPPRVVNR